jgi:hypothetical protein
VRVRAWASAAAPGAILCLVLAACAEPLPQSRKSYVGEWIGPEIRLEIGADGRVVYARREGNVTTSIEAPIQRFEGDSFVVGFAFMTTTFVVTRAPYQNAGRWLMVVDGVELARAERSQPSTSI